VSNLLQNEPKNGKLMTY